MMSLRSYRCRSCGEVFGSAAAVRWHRARDHRRDVRESSTPADSPAPAVSPDSPQASPEGSPRRIEELTQPSADVTTSETRQIRPPRPQVRQRAIRFDHHATGPATAEAVREALPLDTLAGLVRTLSISLSEADGAGPSGYLSEVQATQIAYLLHDATVEFVARRFRGQVDRFKVLLAVIIIIAAKGPVHVRAIRAKAAARAHLTGAEHESPDDVDPIGRGLPVDIPREMATQYAGAFARQSSMMRGDADA